MRVRAFLALSLALVVTPFFLQADIETPRSIITMVVMLGREIVIGLALGLAVRILFSGLQLTGQIVGQMSGMSLADVFDPAFDASIPIFAQLLNLVALAVYLCIGGHRQLMHVLLGTFHYMPPGRAGFSGDLVSAITSVTTQSFALGIRAAAPAMVALLLSVLIMGLISRTLPQMNIMAVGFSLNSVVMLLVMSASLGTAVWIFQENTEIMMQQIQETFLSPNT